MNGKIYCYFNKRKFEEEGIKKYYIGQTVKSIKGRAGKESIITTPNSNQEVNHSYIGRIEEYQEGIAKISTRNPFALGDTIEVLSPKKELRTFQVQSIKNELGEYLEESKKPMASLYIPIPFPVEKEDFLRRISHD